MSPENSLIFYSFLSQNENNQKIVGKKMQGNVDVPLGSQLPHPLSPESVPLSQVFRFQASNVFEKIPEKA